MHPSQYITQKANICDQTNDVSFVTKSKQNTSAQNTSSRAKYSQGTNKTDLTYLYTQKRKEQDRYSAILAL